MATVIQTDHAPITAQQLTVAFESIDRLARADAVRMAKNQFGFFVEGLGREEAQALHLAMTSQGIATRVVDDKALFSLPSGRKVKRLEAHADRLVIFDTMGRPKDYAWADVLVVAAGHVRFVRFARQEQATWGAGGDDDANANVMSGSDSVLTEKDQTELRLELIINDATSRYRADGAEMLYHYLGDRQAPEAAANFKSVVKDLVSHAPAAVCNQGAVSIAADADPPVVYPSRKIFEREIVWLMWWATHRG